MSTVPSFRISVLDVSDHAIVSDCADFGSAVTAALPHWVLRGDGAMLLFSVVSPRIVAYSRQRHVTVLGCMSGTSVDGIDIACADLELDGDELGCDYRGLLSVPFDAALRDRIVAALPPGQPGAGELCQLHAELGDAYAAAFATAAGSLAGGQPDFAVLHGQTFFHWVDEAGHALGTLQLGNSAAVAERLGVPVISDLRSRDVAAGGQGAPMVSMFDRLLLAARPGPVAAVNLGGIANLTVVDDGQVRIAYDIGPAGALMDPAAAQASGGALAFDADGRLAARGTVSAPLLARLKAEPYYRLPPPRSTGRELFNAEYLRAAVAGTEPRPAGEDVCATVTRLLVDLLADAARQHGLAELVMSGGGSSNPTTLTWLRQAVPGVRVLTTDDLGVPAQAKEALAFAVLGFLTWNGLPGSVTAATGARHQAILGTIQPGAGPLILPEPASAAPRYLRVRGS
jgi:anhydro-N-acetylmuramic acid kinase